LELKRHDGRFSSNILTRNAGNEKPFFTI